jgi:predicted nuclease of predicted toxin-antitoxin system
VTALFAKLYLDENIAIQLAALLTHRGFCATTAHAAGLLGADDPTQLSYASTHGYCLVTHNRRDFEQLRQHVLAAGQAHAGIIIASAHNVYTLADRLVMLLNTLTADEMLNQLLYI